MKPTIVKHKKNELILEFDEIDQGLLNAINDAIWQQKGIDQAGFRIDHPEIGKPVFIIKTTGTDAKKIWNSAVDILSKQVNNLATQLKKV